MSFWNTSFQLINKTCSLKSCSYISLYFTHNPVNSPRHILRVKFCSFPLTSTVLTCLCFCKKDPLTLTTNCSIPNFLYRNKWVTVSLIIPITGHKKSVYYVHTDSELLKTAVWLRDIVRSSL